MTNGLKTEELKGRSEDTYVRYIGALQERLRLLTEKKSEDPDDRSSDPDRQLSE
jgi:hypothetical protein